MSAATTIAITLPTMERAKEFVALVSDFPFEMDLRSDRYVVDAKSILGILSLTNRTHLSLDIYAENPDKLLEALASFRV